MARSTSYSSQAQTAARDAANSRWVELLARLGYAAKGVVYLIIGLLAVQVAWGGGGQITGGQGALHTIAGQPFGQVLLWLMVIGLFGYVVWRFVQSVLDVEHCGTDGKGIAKRVAQGVSGVVYGSLAVYAANLAMGSGGGGSSSQGWTGRLMSDTWGVWLVGLIGAVVVGYGLRQLYHAYQVDFTKRLVTSEMSPTERTWTIRVGRFGMAARGVVLIMIGWFFIQAAVTHDPSRARGLDGALAELAGTGYGPWVLGLVALGLVAYGAYQLVLARYRRMPVGSPGGA